ncbi:MAG TPA: site-specific integrase [Terriglobia bacterium]|nr:site-specific integrase [Terriglobia bacterium]
MTKHNPDNERIKRRYFSWLKEAKGYSEASLDAAAKALSRFEEYNRYKSFDAFHFEQAVAFKRHLAEQTGKRSGKKLSKATLSVTLKQLRAFFFWLADQPGYKSRLRHSDADYFNLSEKDTRVATAQREQKSATLEQVRRVIETMPSGNEIERRDRALVAFTVLSGARDSAIASMKLKHVDLTESCVHQDAREVKTKFSKTFTTYFFPVGESVLEIVAEWVRFLREDKLWGNDDPLFPATRIVVGQTCQFEAAGLERANWSNAGPIRKIFREAFEHAGLPYFNPHSIRKTLARFGQEVCNSPEEYKAWSQNLGHEQVLTTFLNYGSVATERQGEIIRGLGTARPSEQPGADEIAEAVFRKFQSAGTGPSSAP